MAKPSAINNRLRHISNDILPALINQSAWISYDDLSARSDASEISARLLGFDVSEEYLEELFASSYPTPSEGYCAAVARRCDTYKPDVIRRCLMASIEMPCIADQIRRSNSIMIKLGLVQAERWTSHATPTPLFLGALIDVIREVRPDATILLSDGSGHERDTQYLLQATGISRLIRRDGNVRFVDLNTDDLIPSEVPSPLSLRQILLPRSLVDTDLLISLAKMKTHKWTGVSLGMKNLFGALPGAVYGFPKNQLHWACLPRAIADITSVVCPELVIIDGVTGIEGNGPLNGRCVRAGVVVIGQDVVATDAVATQLMGISPYVLPTFWFAAQKALGTLGNPQPSDVIRDMIKLFSPPPSLEWIFGSVFKPIEEQLSMAKSHLLRATSKQPPIA